MLQEEGGPVANNLDMRGQSRDQTQVFFNVLIFDDYKDQGQEKQPHKQHNEDKD